MRILFVEDDAVLGEAVHDHMCRAGHAVDWFRTGQDADLALDTVNYDLVLLDLGLPDASGFDVLKLWRARKNTTPVIIATARDRIDDRIEGLNAGADDYLVKPYDLNELGARIHAISRRVSNVAIPDFEHAELRVDLASRQVFKGEKQINLTAREWAVLELLVARAGIAVSKSDLESRMYQFGAEIDSNAVEVFISRIRKKLGRDLIRTERGIGYKLVTE